MSEFEFQRFITIGQYMPTDSTVHRLDPRTRLVGGSLLIIAVTVAPTLPGLGIALMSALAIILLARVPLGYALKGLLPPLPFILVLVVLQVLLGPNAGGTPPLWHWGPFRISVDSLLSGAEILVRFPVLILLITTLSACTSTSETVRGLEDLLRPLSSLGVPTQDVVLMVQVALRFLPLLAREAEHIAKSQASRGADWGTGRGGVFRRARQALPILVPLFLVGLQRGENLAVAMEARGYQSQRRRTSLITLRFGLRDVMALVVCLGLATLIVVV
ncbi:MAG: energy-coupling factor transporter transmembrane component T family protein [Anaerolineae bacterium]